MASFSLNDKKSGTNLTRQLCFSHYRAEGKIPRFSHYTPKKTEVNVAFFTEKNRFFWLYFPVFCISVCPIAVYRKKFDCLSILCYTILVSSCPQKGLIHYV